mmetsp:Transcript_26232/g.29208  ORF Transcript_26232/g.29208 Transcript_26232/m.29208 type:complete len:252 (-) Transcript_26232:71-826(-)
MFGSLFAKSLRVVMIMRQADKLKVIIVSDAHVFFYVLLFVGVDLVLLVLYSILANPQSVLNYPDPYRLDMAYKTCVTKNDTTNTVFIALFASYKCLLMLIGIYTGWEVHYIKYKHLNESKVIAFALYNVIFFAVLGFGFSYALNDDSNETTRYGLYALRSLSVVLAAGLTIVALFLQKILLIKGLLEDSSSPSSSGTASDPQLEIPDIDSMTSRANSEWEKRYLEEKNKTAKLRKRVAKLKAKVIELENQK